VIPDRRLKCAWSVAGAAPAGREADTFIGHVTCLHSDGGRGSRRAPRLTPSRGHGGRIRREPQLTSVRPPAAPVASTQRGGASCGSGSTGRAHDHGIALMLATLMALLPRRLVRSVPLRDCRHGGQQECGPAGNQGPRSVRGASLPASRLPKVVMPGRTGGRCCGTVPGMPWRLMSSFGGCGRCLLA
jgi:hypothetical protein